MSIFRFMLPVKNHGVLIRKFLSLNQSTATHLGRVGRSLQSCTIHRRTLCSNSTSKGQFKDESKVQNTVFYEVVPEKDERFSSKLYNISPNESWSQETMKLYNELRKQVDESNGLWVAPEFTVYTGEYSSFHTSVDENGKRLFEFYRIVNKSEKRLKGVCQFGPCTMGPKGYVHGGAIAAMLDVLTAGIPNRIGYRAVTANLSVDFKLPVPVGSTLLMEGNIESVEGKKIYVNGEIKSSDGLQLYATAKTLCIVINDNK